MRRLRAWAFLAAATFPALAWAGEMKFEKTLIQLTAKPDQERVEADFRFEVVGEGEAVIQNVDAPCSCLEAQISDNGRLRWKPGETGTVKGLFKVGRFRGTLDKEIWLVMADGTRHGLTVRLTTPELLKVEPKTLKWFQGEEAKEQSFSIKVTAENPIKILGVTGTNEEKFPYELETIVEGAEYRLTVKPTDTEERGFGLLRIATDSQYQKHKTYQAYVVVTKKSARQ